MVRQAHQGYEKTSLFKSRLLLRQLTSGVWQQQHLTICLFCIICHLCTRCKPILGNPPATNQPITHSPRSHIVSLSLHLSTSVGRYGGAVRSAPAAGLVNRLSRKIQKTTRVRSLWVLKKNRTESQLPNYLRGCCGRDGTPYQRLSGFFLFIFSRVLSPSVMCDVWW